MNLFLRTEKYTGTYVLTFPRICVDQLTRLFRFLSLGRKLRISSKIKLSMAACVLKCCIPFHVLLPNLAFIVGREALLWVNTGAVSFSHENIMASNSWIYVLTALLKYFCKGCIVFKSRIKGLCRNSMAVIFVSSVLSGYIFIEIYWF